VIYTKKTLVILLSLIIISLFVSSWFKPGYQLGGGEESLTIFNYQNILEQNGIWGKNGTGFANPLYLSRIPLSYFVQGLLNLGLELWRSQQVVYILLMFSGFWGMFLFTKALLKKDDIPLICLTSASLYTFNLYSMANIWARFIYSGMFMWAYLPWFCYIWIKWLEVRHFIWLIALILLSLVYALAFNQPANLITIWSLPLISLLAIIIKYRKNFIEIRRILISASIFFIVWVVSNSWWIIPFIKLQNLVAIDKLDPNANFGALSSVSQYFKTQDMIYYYCDKVIFMNCQFFKGSTRKQLLI
jgi:hypothetical protein